MSIERSIYASLPLGVGQDSPGFQFYSYTPEFKHMVESDASGAVHGAATAGYTKHSGNEWLTEIPLDADINSVNQDDYPVSLPQSVEAANNAELRAQRTHPYSMSYKTVNIGGVEKGLFWFGKNLGIDWSGARPGNIYLYSLVCDMTDIKKAPVMYCSSPAVCCNIMREQFYPESGKLSKPGYLRNISSLDDDEGIANLEYSAGFEEITIKEISNFILADENRKILCSMLSTLMELKDGNPRCRLIIADERRNIMLWIAALSYVFPLENLLEMSFSSYTHTPSDFDINGVFEPSLNNCFKDSRSGYDFQTARGSYAVYDFSNGSYAPEVNVKTGLFMDMINNAFEINLSLLDNYKKYIVGHTAYRGLDSDYAKGYDLYAYMTDMVKFDFSNAVGFAEKFANPSEKKALLLKILDNYEKITENQDNLSCVNGYIEHCCAGGITTREKINEFFVDKFNTAFRDKSVSGESVKASGKLCTQICGISEDELGVLFVKTNGTSKLAEFVTQTADVWRIMYINNAILLYVEKCGVKIELHGDEGKIITTTISRMITDDTSECAAQIDNYIQGNFNIVHSIPSRIGICSAVFCALNGKRFNNCCDKVLSNVSAMYLSEDESAGDQTIAEIERSEFSDFFIKDILSTIRRESNVGKRIDSLRSFCERTEKYTKKYANDIKSIANDSVKDISDLFAENILKTYYSAFLLFKLLKVNCGIECSAAELEAVYRGYITDLNKRCPDYIVDKEHVERLAEIKSAVERRGGDGCDEVFDIFRSLSVLNENVELPPKESCFSEESDITYRPINVSMLDAPLGQCYLESVGKLCGEFWVKNDSIPAFQRLVISDKKQTKDVNQKIFKSMLKTALKKIKHNGRAAADAIEFSIVNNYTEILSTLDSWLDECDVRKGVVDCLSKDYKAKTELKKGSDQGILGEVDPVVLQERLEQVKAHYEGRGFIGGLKSLFKRK